MISGSHLILHARVLPEACSLSRREGTGPRLSRPTASHPRCALTPPPSPRTPPTPLQVRWDWTIPYLGSPAVLALQRWQVGGHRSRPCRPGLHGGSQAKQRAGSGQALGPVQGREPGEPGRAGPRSWGVLSSSLSRWCHLGRKWEVPSRPTTGAEADTRVTSAPTQPGPPPSATPGSRWPAKYHPQRPVLLA